MTGEGVRREGCGREEEGYDRGGCEEGEVWQRREGCGREEEGCSSRGCEGERCEEGRGVTEEG